MPHGGHPFFLARQPGLSKSMTFLLKMTTPLLSILTSYLENLIMQRIKLAMQFGLFFWHWNWKWNHRTEKLPGNSSIILLPTVWAEQSLVLPNSHVRGERSKRKTWLDAQATPSPVLLPTVVISNDAEQCAVLLKEIGNKKISKPLGFCQAVCPHQPFFSRLEAWAPPVGSAARLVDAASSRTPR